MISKEEKKFREVVRFCKKGGCLAQKHNANSCCIYDDRVRMHFIVEKREDEGVVIRANSIIHSKNLALFVANSCGVKLITN